MLKTDAMNNFGAHSNESTLGEIDEMLDVDRSIVFSQLKFTRLLFPLCLLLHVHQLAIVTHKSWLIPARHDHAKQRSPPLLSPCTVRTPIPPRNRLTHSLQGSAGPSRPPLLPSPWTPALPNSCFDVFEPDLLAGVQRHPLLYRTHEQFTTKAVRSLAFHVKGKGICLSSTQREAWKDEWSTRFLRRGQRKTLSAEMHEDHLTILSTSSLGTLAAPSPRFKLLAAEFLVSRCLSGLHGRSLVNSAYGFDHR